MAGGALGVGNFAYELCKGRKGEGAMARRRLLSSSAFQEAATSSNKKRHCQESMGPSTVTEAQAPEAALPQCVVSKDSC